MADRRYFLGLLAGAVLTGLCAPRAGHAAAAVQTAAASGSGRSKQTDDALTLFLCGDLMTGRGIDQILPDAVPPQLYEPYIRDARDYVRLAEQVNGRVAAPVTYAYVWGDALAELAEVAPDLRIVNLETAITAHPQPWPKGINYRMHPRNVAVLSAAGVDCCVLANNHVLDWGAPGLTETLATLDAAGIRHAGAGPDLAAAQAPAVLPLPGRTKARVLVFAYGSASSGIDDAWAATAQRPGVNLLPDLSAATVAGIAAQVAAVKANGDIAVASIHWGGNWGYEIPAAQRSFAHALIDRARIDVVHGHSSHHPRGIEVYHERPIIYGCGDLLNDYEGIRGHARYRGELGLMYFPSLAPASGRLQRFTLTPMRIRRLRLQRAAPAEVDWLADMLNREGRALGTRVVRDARDRLVLHWAEG